MKSIVIPGDRINDGVSSNGAYVEDGKNYASVMGFYDEGGKRVVPLEGMWLPKIEDTVVGVVVNAGRNNSYTIDLNTFRTGVLLLGKYSRSTLKAGEMIEAIVDRINGKKEVILSRPRELRGGIAIKVKPTKIPRVLGKANTMANQIAELTKCDMVIGSNGIVWIRGGDTALAIEAIRRIEREAHLSGLTERIKEMLSVKGK
jgi:exosome complex component RRP4